MLLLPRLIVCLDFVSLFVESLSNVGTYNTHYHATTTVSRGFYWLTRFWWSIDGRIVTIYSGVHHLDHRTFIFSVGWTIWHFTCTDCLPNVRINKQFPSSNSQSINESTLQSDAVSIWYAADNHCCDHAGQEI